VLKCVEAAELATDYMERELPPRAWLAMRLHLALCSMCRAYLDQLRKTKRLLGVVSPAPAPPDVETRLVASATAPQPPEPPP
jgi:predicted anti-sigma-YlaC factor YlaD